MQRRPGWRRHFGQGRQLAGVVAAATLLTAVIAAGVLRAPSERVFGMEIVGRHHDPFTVMAQFVRPMNPGVHWQPVTDIGGTLLERMSGPVAAYNWLVLLTFPLAAVAAYLLARHLQLSATAATMVGLIYAFSPFHLAQSAYHPHVAQVHWLALYVLALWRCLDHATRGAVLLLVAATAGVTLSNFYGGLIAVVTTPIAVATYWAVAHRVGRASFRSLIITAGTLASAAMAGIAYVWFVAGTVLVDRTAQAFARDDLFRYSAKWWSYLVPPVAHPLLGGAVRQFWADAAVREGLLEQQVSLGAGVVILGFIALAMWYRSRRPQAALAYVPVLVAVAATALLCSLSPERTIGAFTFVRPAALIYPVAPMFRAYARFGVVVQLMAALLAGIGIDHLRQAATRRARLAWIVLVLLIAGEYVVSPWAMSRDVLPTAAHRWVARQSGHLRVLDCTPPREEANSVSWLTAGRVVMLGGVIEDCTESGLAEMLVSAGYTHLLVRRGSPAARGFVAGGVPEGLQLAARFNDAQVFAVTAPAPTIYTATMKGFSPREHDLEWAWRWIGPDAGWTIVNAGTGPVVARLELELAAFQRTRRLALLLDGREVDTLVVGPTRGRYQSRQITMTTGAHELVFRPVEPPTPVSDVLDNGDRRALSVAFGAWKWRVVEMQP